MGRIKLSDIKSLPYEGYLWRSDQEQPEILDKQSVSVLKEGNFVVEGQLYNEEQGLSYSIRHVDGEYRVYEFVVTDDDLKSPDNQLKCYESNRMDGRKLRFLRYWEECLDKDNVQSDGFPVGLPVLTQTKNVFIGFER